MNKRTTYPPDVRERGGVSSYVPPKKSSAEDRRRCDHMERERNGFLFQGQERAGDATLLTQLGRIVGRKHLLTRDSDTRSYRTGFRYGSGRVLAVVRPGSLVELWRVAQACVEAGAIVIMQASNTGLTGGSTPDGDDYDRDVVLVNTLRINRMHLIDDGRQVVCLPGATLFRLEKLLKSVEREPHSVIGSSCIGASVFGGVCNNSGGALIRRGPAYTELALYGQVGGDGRLRLVNNLGIRLGNDPEEILRRVEEVAYTLEDIENDGCRASDSGYETRVRDVTADTPARYNADRGRLYQASGSAGHLILFALRLDTFPAETNPVVFYIGSNATSDLEGIRRDMLASDMPLPIAAEYMHRDSFEFTRVYGKDTFLAIKYLGSGRLPALFKLKAKIDTWASRLPLVHGALGDLLMQSVSKLFPEHLPKRLRDFGARFAHHLILKVSADQAAAVSYYLEQKLSSSDGEFFQCKDEEAQAAFLHRFAAAGAAGRYRAVHRREVEDIVALDIALRRNDQDWREVLPREIEKDITHKLYYGHFFCHVFHQVYVVKKGANLTAMKSRMLELLDARGARYPAEHNVGHLYQAPPDQTEFFRNLDPCNCLNPGIGQTSKRARWH